jgi:hypothetical protein
VAGEARSLEGMSATLLHLVGIAGEILILTAIYLVMPVGRLSGRRLPEPSLPARAGNG